MALNNETGESAFRSSKKRKVIRRRTSPSEDGDAAFLDQAGVEDHDDFVDTASIPIHRRRPKKYGVAFSGNDSVLRQATPNDVLALVPREAETPNAPQVERFVRSTGKAIVTEDKHMSAFIDAKLAELRSVPTTPVKSGQTHSDPVQQSDDATNVSTNCITSKSQRNIISIQPMPLNKRQRRHPRRQPKVPTGADIARDQLVDQILQESSLPVYDTSSRTFPSDQNGTEQDNDTAAAAAFKADFLAEMAERKYSRRPPANAAAPTTGPKLGGSRMAREKMKALEDRSKPTSSLEKR